MNLVISFHVSLQSLVEVLVVPFLFLLSTLVLTLYLLFKRILYVTGLVNLSDSPTRRRWWPIMVHRRTSNSFIIPLLYELYKPCKKTCTCFTLLNLNLWFRWNQLLLTTTGMANRRVPNNNYRLLHGTHECKSSITGCSTFPLRLLDPNSARLWFESGIRSLYSKRISNCHNRIKGINFESVLPVISRIHAINNLHCTHYV